SEPLENSGETAAIGAFGGSPTGATDANGSAGIYAVGGDGVGNAQADFAGDAAELFGGFTPESSSGAAGYGIYATGGVGGVGVAAYAGYFDGNINVTGTVFGGGQGLQDRPPARSREQIPGSRFGGIIGDDEYLHRQCNHRRAWRGDSPAAGLVRG